MELQPTEHLEEMFIMKETSVIWDTNQPGNGFCLSWGPWARWGNCEGLSFFN